MSDDARPLSASEDWLRSVWDLAADAMVLSDPNGLVLSANAAYYQLYGYSAEQVLGHNFAIIFPESGRAAAIELYRQVFAADSVPPHFENVVQRADGALRTVETHINFLIVDGRRVAMQSVIRDVTEHKQAEADLRAAREAAQALANELEQRVTQRTAELRALATDLQTAREDERRRLSRELHDELGGALTVLKMTLRRLGQRLADTDAPSLPLVAEMADQIDNTVTLVRKLASELRPAILDDLGLVAALDWQLQEFRAHSGLDCQFYSPLETVRLSPEQSIAIYRVAQESLTNIARHAQATRVTVSFTEEEGWLVLRVRDNGQGFDPIQASGVASLGLTGMRERAYTLLGELMIDSAPGRGATVTMRVAAPA